jgi:hypothetical protein
MPYLPATDAAPICHGAAIRQGLKRQRLKRQRRSGSHACASRRDTIANACGTRLSGVVVAMADMQGAQYSAGGSPASATVSMAQGRNFIPTAAAA